MMDETTEDRGATRNLTDKSSTERENACGIEHVPRGWDCCPDCLRWVPTDDRTCPLCNGDVTEVQR